MKLSLLILLLMVLFIISFSFFYYMELAKDKTIHPGNSQPLKKTLRVESEYALLSEELAALEREEIFWKNRIEIAKNDQFNLILNIPDSLLELEIRGISVQQSKIQCYTLCPELNKNKDKWGSIKWLRQPVSLREQWATIPKRPIRVRDISTMQNLADSLNFTPASDDSEDVSIILVWSRNLSIGISQIKEPLSDNPFLYRNIEQESVSTQSSVTDSVRFGDLLQKDWISIKIRRLDVTAIYRALSEKSQLAIRL